MVPHMTLKQRILAWLIWKINGWKDLDDCRFECIEHPEMSNVSSICRDYWYLLNARKYDSK